MRKTIRLFLFIEGASFVGAGLIHRGVLIQGYAHRQASIAESSIAALLLVGLALTWIWPAWTRPIGIIAQSLALAGTLLGVSLIAIGVGPRTVPDVAYHLIILTVLAWGLLVATRAPAGEAKTHKGEAL